MNHLLRNLAIVTIYQQRLAQIEALGRSKVFHRSATMRMFSSLPNAKSPIQTSEDDQRLFPEEINIIYDSKCNVCKLEIDFLARRDAEKVNVLQPKLKMTDLESGDYDPLDPKNGGITYEEGMAAIHAVTADGKVMKGVPVFAIAYEQVGLGWLFKISTWPVFKQIFEVGYNLFAKYRTNITRGAGIEDLVREYEMKKAMQQKAKEEDCISCESKAL